MSEQLTASTYPHTPQLNSPPPPSQLHAALTNSKPLSHRQPTPPQPRHTPTQPNQTSPHPYPTQPNLPLPSPTPSHPNPISSHPIPSHLIPSHPISSHLIPSHLIPSQVEDRLAAREHRDEALAKQRRADHANQLMEQQLLLAGVRAAPHTALTLPQPDHTHSFLSQSIRSHPIRFHSVPPHSTLHHTTPHHTPTLPAAPLPTDPPIHPTTSHLITSATNHSNPLQPTLSHATAHG